MARSKAKERDSAPQPAAPVEQQPAPAELPPSDTNGSNGPERKPVQAFSYLVAKDTFVQASVWDRTVRLPDTSTFTTYDVTLRKRYKDAKDGEWKSASSFRGSEIYALVHALQQASGWILEARAGAQTIPF